jgi:hypothetical protein
MPSLFPSPVPALALVAVVGGALGAGSLPAAANQINTGGESGAYHRSFCPALSRELKVAQFDHACGASAGTRENIERVLGNPRQHG